MVGVAIFLVGDTIVERKFGDEGVGGSMGIIVGSVVDGVPESMIFGIQLAAGIPVSISFLGAVFVSNIPQAVGPSADLAAAGWNGRRLGRVWLLVVLGCGVAARSDTSPSTSAAPSRASRLAALAAGGLLAMLTNSLVPFAYERGGQIAGVATVVGFCVSVIGT